MAHGRIHVRRSAFGPIRFDSRCPACACGTPITIDELATLLHIALPVAHAVRSFAGCVERFNASPALARAATHQGRAPRAWSWSLLRRLSAQFA